MAVNVNVDTLARHCCTVVKMILNGTLRLDNETQTNSSAIFNVSGGNILLVLNKAGIIQNNIGAVRRQKPTVLRSDNETGMIARYTLNNLGLNVSHVADF